MIYIIEDSNTLFASSETGSPLPDALECTVQEVRNGAFCTVMTYPFDGMNADLIAVNAILMVPPRPNAKNEPFRIYEIDQTIKGIMTVRANHIVYDLDGKLAPGMNKTGITAVLETLNTWAGSHFLIEKDGITNETEVFQIITPESVWAAIGGKNSLLSHFGGELSYTWDTFNRRVKIKLHSARGTEKNTVITYGVNIISMTRKKTVGNMYSVVMAYWSDGQNAANTVFSNGYTTGVTAIDRWLLLDMTKEYKEAPTAAELNAYVQDYIAKHDFTVQNELTVEYIPLENTTDYEPLPIAVVGSAIVGTSVTGNANNLLNNETLNLCDIGTVDASFVGVAAKAKCVEVIFDVLKNRYTKTTIGTIQNTIVDEIVKLAEVI